jgi:hypothetical protein
MSDTGRKLFFKEKTIIMSKSSSSSSGIGFLGLLTVAFIVLKLLDIIDWSWFGVLAPLYVAPIFLILLFLVFSLITWIIKG